MKVSSLPSTFSERRTFSSILNYPLRHPHRSSSFQPLQPTRSLFPNLFPLPSSSFLFCTTVQSFSSVPYVSTTVFSIFSLVRKSQRITDIYFRIPGRRNRLQEDEGGASGSLSLVVVGGGRFYRPYSSSFNHPKRQLSLYSSLPSITYRQRQPKVRGGTLTHSLLRVVVPLVPFYYSSPFSTTTTTTSSTSSSTLDPGATLTEKTDEPIMGNDTTVMEVQVITDYLTNVKQCAIEAYSEEYMDWGYDEDPDDELDGMEEDEWEEENTTTTTTTKNGKNSSSTTSPTSIPKNKATDNHPSSVGENNRKPLTVVGPPSYCTPDEINDIHQRLQKIRKERQARPTTVKNQNGLSNIFSDGENFHTIYQNIQLNCRTHTDAFNRAGIVVPEPLPIDLRKTLLAQINAYVAKPSTLIDYHPGSNNKVQDIVHPSLYPYVDGLSIVDETTNPPPRKEPPAKESTLPSLPYFEDLDRWGRSITPSTTYQWLPSQFDIADNGKVTINSYINNLPTEETDLYATITRAFEHVLPSLEQSWAYSRQVKYYNPAKLDFYSGLSSENSIRRGYGSLRNRSLQVITKIVRITLAPYEKNDPTGDHELVGAWHAEGMTNEDIVATASLTLSKDPHFTSTIYFQRLYTEDEARSLYNELPQNPPREIENFLNDTLVPLGKYRIREGDILVFPNSHIHAINMINQYNNDEYLRDPMAEKERNMDGSSRGTDPSSLFTRPAERTLLVFWLVNPQRTVLSTKHIREQQKYNPAFTLEKAYEHRLKLMKERTEVKQRHNQSNLNLCEH